MNVLMTPVMITCYLTPVMIMVIICWLRYVSKRPKYCSLYSATNASYRACVYIVYSLCLRVFTSRSPQRAEYRALSKRFEKSLPSALRILLLNIIEYIYIYVGYTTKLFSKRKNLSSSCSAPQSEVFQRDDVTLASSSNRLRAEYRKEDKTH